MRGREFIARRHSVRKKDRWLRMWHLCHNSAKCACPRWTIGTAAMIVGQQYKDESGELEPCGCVLDVVGKRRGCWAPSASPLRCYGAAQPRRRLGFISCAAGLAYSRRG